ncbi:MAG: Atxe2 family lasso peptide isopeptidase [Kordiimonadaceae bacterium]|nr:Atxe2 family lasso peptide isopeptidase [Kordiimonadaceae bacterium]
MAIFSSIQGYAYGLAQLMFGQRTKVFSIVAILMVSCVASSASDATRGITADDLLTIRDIKTMTISPDGNYVAYEVVQADKNRNDYDVSWYVAATKAGVQPIMATNGGEAALSIGSLGLHVGDIASSEIVWSPDSEWIYFTKVQQGAVQIWRNHRSGDGADQITNNAADVEGLKFLKNKSMLFFAVGRNRADIKENNKKEALRGYLVQEPTLYSVQDGPYLPPCRDGQKRWVWNINKNQVCSLIVWVFDIKEDVERKATVEETEAYFADVDTSLRARVRRGKLKGQARLMETASSDGKNLVWFENEDATVFKGVRPPMRVVASDGSKKFRCPVTEACRSTQPIKLWWNMDDTEVIFLVRNGYRDTLNSLYGWIPGQDNVRTILSTDDMFYDCDLASTHLICGHESWVSPKKIVSVDLATSEVSTIIDMNVEFQNFSFTRVEKILGEDAYGNKAHAHLVYPKDYVKGQRYPLVIVQYLSSGFLRGGTGDEQPIHVLAQNGFAVLSFDMPRLDGDDAKVDNLLDLNIRGVKYDEIDRGPATALENMVDILKKKGLIDPKRVGITGLSAGAQTLTTALLAKNYAAASTAAIGGPPPSFELPPFSFFRKVKDHVFGGTPFSATGFDMRAKHSIGLNAHRIDTPLLVQIPDREYLWSKQNYHALKEASKPVEAHIYPNEYHVKWQPAHRYMVYSRNIDWFNFWLRDVEDKDSTKAEQYKRWKDLRQKHHANLQLRLSKR